MTAGRSGILVGTIVMAGMCAAGRAQPAKPYDGRLAVTHVGMVAPDIMGVTLRAGKIAHGGQVPYEAQPGDRVSREGAQRWVSRRGRYIGSLVGRDERLIYTPDRYVGARLDSNWADAPASYRVTSADDPGYTAGIVPAAAFRKTRPTDLGRVGPRNAWQFDSPSESVVYLRLPRPLSQGKSYQVSFQGAPLAPLTLRYEPRQLRSEAVHVSQVGFHPGDPAKVAFLSCWLGSGGPLDYRPGLGFEVVDVGTGRVVFKGATVLAKAKDDRTEDAYKRNFNGTDVYVMDFAGLRRPGRYVVSVQGIGCSHPFAIRDDAWRAAFTVSARGFYHQRSGIALGPPYTTFRRARSFHPADGVTVRASSCALMDSGNGLNYRGSDKNNFQQLVAGKTDRIVPDAWGAYMDAGDWDRRIQHLVVSHYLLELFEMFPGYFDGLTLNIPESNDGLPDLVSEALFNLDGYRRMQAADGGIRGGIESAEHPRVGEGSWQESLDVFAYAPGIWSSHWYAGAAARAATVLRSLASDVASVYTDSAVRAMEYAERRWPELGQPNVKGGGVVDTRNMAAAALYRLTGDERWHRVFLETTAFTDPKADVFKWPTHEQRDSAWVYLNTKREDVNRAVQRNCRAATLREADERVRGVRKTGFRWTRNPWRPASWGSFSVPDAIGLVRAHRVTGDPRYLSAAVLTCQFTVGANPMNLCLTTGLGHKAPLHPLHIDSRVTDQPPPAGLTVFGPLGHKEGKGQWGQKLASQTLFPAFEKWPVAEAYWDVFWYPAMCEFTVQGSMAPTAYVFGYLAACERGQAQSGMRSLR